MSTETTLTNVSVTRTARSFGLFVVDGDMDAITTEEGLADYGNCASAPLSDLEFLRHIQKGLWAHDIETVPTHSASGLFPFNGLEVLNGNYPGTIYVRTHRGKVFLHTLNAFDYGDGDAEYGPLEHTCRLLAAAISEDILTVAP